MRLRIYISYLDSSAQQMCLLSPIFNHLFISVCSHGYLLYTLGYNPILLYLVAQIILALATGNPFN